MAEFKRINTREFLRHINDIEGPVQVYSRDRKKGTWLPGDMTWPKPDPIEQIKQAGVVLRAIRKAATETGDPHEG